MGRTGRDVVRVRQELEHGLGAGERTDQVHEGRPNEIANPLGDGVGWARGHWRLRCGRRDIVQVGDGVAAGVIPILHGLVSDQAENSSHDVPNNQLSGLRGDELAADGADPDDELIDIGPFIFCDNLQEDVGGGYGASFGAAYLPSLEQSGRMLVSSKATA